MQLEELRKEIDRLDSQLIQLLEARMILVDQVTSQKKITGQTVLDSSREQAVLAHVASQVTKQAYEKALVGTFSDIMKHSRIYQNEKLGS